MNPLSGNNFLMMQRSLEFLWSKQSCILDNIANVETPDYKVKYATFEEALQGAVLDAAGAGGSAASMRAAIASAPVRIHEAQESTRLDENGVNLSEQMVELSRNAYQMQYVMQAISNEISTLRTVIRR